MYRGLAASALGPTGTIVLTSLVWSVVHIQYDWFYLVHIFAVGLLLGAVRYKSGSTLLTIVLHALMNLVATLEMYVVSELL
jgi:membrane protease YdiL (CAAX protease family)